MSESRVNISNGRSKRRSLGQRIGKKGEKTFEVWATDNNLTTQKVDDEDYGIDFFCQAMEQIKSDVEEITGAVLAAQVRSVEGGRRKRVKLDRCDAETALRMHSPFCLFGVDVGTNEVYFRFLDETFIRDLRDFLSSKTESKSFRLDTMQRDPAIFAKELKAIVKPSYQTKLQWLKARLQIEAVAPGARLSIQQSTAGDFAIISVPWVASLLDISDSHREVLMNMFLETGKFPPPATPGISFKKELGYLQGLVDGPVYLAGGVEAEIDFSVDLGGIKETIPFRLLHFGDQWSFISSTGLLLSFSGVRDIDRKFVHEFHYSILKDNACDLASSPDELRLLKLLRPGAKLYETGKSGFDINHWGNLEELGRAVEALETAYRNVKLSLSGVFLADLCDEEFSKTVFTIDLLCSGTLLNQLMPGFVLGLPKDDPIDHKRWALAGFRLPIVANLKDHGIIIWLEGEGQIYINEENLMAGFRPGPQCTWDIEIRGTRFSKSTTCPECWINKIWPPIPLFDSSAVGDRVFQHGFELNLAGEIWVL